VLAVVDSDRPFFDELAAVFLEASPQQITILQRRISPARPPASHS